MAIPKTNTALTTSLKVFITAEDSQRHEIGTLLNINPSERREITPNFTIGADVPDEATELIPGVVRDRRITADVVVLYDVPGLKPFGRDDQSIVASLADQNTPFVIQEQISNPRTGKVKTIEYVDCYIENFDETRDLQRPDIRILAKVTIRYRRRIERAYE